MDREMDGDDILRGNKERRDRNATMAGGDRAPAGIQLPRD